MSQDPLRATLDTLRSEREDAERRVTELDQELRGIAQRLKHLRGAIENIEVLLGEPSLEDETVIGDDTDPASLGDVVRQTDFVNTPDAPFGPAESAAPDFAQYSPVARKRVPSTDWVAEVVSQIGEPADRDMIFDTFRQIKGFPDSWTNPRNSVNNALARAVQRGMVRKLEENLFAPLSFKPRASETNDREER